MTSLRKWRFPILIGSGLIAAGVLFYFSNTHLSSDKTQGAIGKRDVYRDGQVASADVATPGSAPVATEAILESSEFKSLAKNQAFQELVRSSEFTELARENAFGLLLADRNFRLMAARPEFASLLRSSVLRSALESHSDMSRALQGTRFEALARTAPMQALLRTDAFKSMAEDRLFAALIVRSDFQAVLRSQDFGLLASNRYFLAALREGTMSRVRSESAVR